MTPERWQRVDRLFQSAVDLPPGDRAAFLDDASQGDAELRGEVESLIKSHEQAGSFIEDPALPTAGWPAGGPSSPERLGAYRILRELGRGGMGRVYLAEQEGEGFRRQVALKVVDRRGDAAEVERRFRDERRILAGLEHPGIARFYDAGRASDGRWFLALEYVEGEDLRAFVERHGLDLRARVELFLQVLDAVDFAHRQLVVHRDLKPGNVLVDAHGRAKLLDFGISKILDPGEEADDTRTERPAFTLAYASPEQLRGERVTVATDIYSAGVMLYELLAGRRPFERRQATDPEADPAPPSAIATTTVPRRELTGDLDAISLKALRPSPDRRYPSAAAFRDDLRRFLEGRPVLARPDTTGYRVRKFVGRHRSSVAAGAALLALLAGALVRERTLRARADAEAHKARAVKEYLVNVFDVADPKAPPGQTTGDVTARALLDRGAARVESALTGQPEVQAELSGVLGRVYVNLGLYDKASPLLHKSLEQRRSVYGPRHPAVAEAMELLGDLFTKQNRYAEAEPLLRESLAQRRALLGDSTEATAMSLDRLAHHLQERNKYEEAEPLFREALAVRQAVHSPDHEKVGDSLNNLALLLSLKGQRDEAEPLYRQALEITVRVFGEDHPKTATSVHNLAQVLHQGRRYDEAEVLYRRSLAASRKTLGNAHPDVTVTLNNLGVLLSIKGKLDESEALIREALALDRQMFGDRHDYVAEGIRNLANVLRLKGDFDGAERAFREAVALNRSLFGEEHRRVALNTRFLAVTLQMKGDLEQAIPLLRDAHAKFGRLLGEKHRDYAGTGLELARVLLESGNVSEAETLARSVSAESSKGSTLAASGQVVLARALARQGRGTEAVAVAESALKSSLELFTGSDWRIAEARLALGEALAASGQRSRAEPVLQEASAALFEQRHAQPRLAAQAAAALARLRRSS
jgi:eukaryotic-like serine/threonine-protein kinase